MNTFLFLCVSWCVYMVGFTQIKWSNAREAVLDMLFMYLCPHFDGISVYVGKKTGAFAIHSFIHSHRDSQNMQDSYLNRHLQLNIYRY